MLSCSFCGKKQDQVKRLVEGLGSVFICDECVDLAREIIEEEGRMPTFDDLKQRMGQQREENEHVAQEASELQCPSCATRCPATYRYCFNCGQKLEPGA